MLRENRLRCRVIALMTALSLLTMIAVPYLRVLPGAALTNGNLNDGVPYMVDEALTSVPPGAADLTGRIKSLSVKVGDNPAQTGTAGGSITVDGGNGNSAGLTIAMTYEFPNQEALAEVLASGYSYYQMDQSIQPNNGYFGDQMRVIDATWNTTKAAGYYSISGDGLIVIHYTEEYLAYLANSKGMVGTLTFKGNVARNQDEGGDRTFRFGTTDVTVEFEDAKPSVTKKGAPDGSGADRAINWSITIRNPGKYADLSDYVLTDILDGDTINWNTANPTFNPPDAVTVGSDGMSLNFKRYDSLEARPETIVINYRQTSGVEVGGEYQNTASLQKGAEEPITDFDIVSIENGLNIEKSGVPDYELKDSKEGKVRWTVTVTHKSGDSLRNVAVAERDAVFNTAFADLQVIDRTTGNVISPDKYTVSADGKTLTFADDSTLPSSADIVYTAQETEYDPNGAAGSSQGLANHVEASRGDITDTAERDGYVSYHHALGFEKTLNGPNQELGTLEWQFTLRSNDNFGSGDPNSRLSINGYTITDPIFEDMTEAEINEKIGFNIYNYTNQTQSKKGDQYTTGAGKVTLTKTSADTIKISFDPSAYPDTVINMIKLYYAMNIRDNLSEADWTRYQNGETVRISNTATAKDRDGHQGKEGTDGKDIHLRVEASKNYIGANDPNNYSFGNEDTADRELYWSVNLTKDAGFTSTDRYEDQLKSSNPAAGHYITPAQRAGFSLIGASASAAEKTPLPANCYTITFVDASGAPVGADENAAGFVITFTEGIDALTPPYHYIQLSYHSTAETSKVPVGENASFSNEYNFGNQPNSTPGMTYTRDNAADVKPLTLTLTKNWNDGNNAFGNRPSTITVKVMRAKAGADGSLPAEPEWELVETQVLGADSTNASSHYTLGTNYPQWEYDEDTDTLSQYYYKVEEVLTDSGYELTDVSDPQKAALSKEPSAALNMSMTNKSTMSFVKQAIDADGAVTDQLSASAVPIETVSIDGTPTKCFMFQWKVILNKDNKNQETYTDTLPDGAVYVGHDNSLPAAYHMRAYWNPNYYVDIAQQAVVNPGWKLVDAASSGSTVTFDVYDDIKWITYCTAVPISALEDALDDDGKLVNTLTRGDKSSSASVEVNGSAPEDTTDHLTKAFNKGVAGGYLNYTVDVNPTGKKLSNDGTIDITDILAYAGGQRSKNDQNPIPLEALDIMLNSIKVYPLVDGEADTSNPLEPSEFSYTVRYNDRDSSELEFSAPQNGKNDGNSVRYWEIKNWKPGQEVTLTIPKNPQYTSGNPQLRIFGYNGEYSSSNLVSGKSFETSVPNPDANGTITAVFTVPEDTEHLVLTAASEQRYADDRLNGYNVALDGVIGYGSGIGVEYVGDFGEYRIWEITGWQTNGQFSVTAHENPAFSALTTDTVGSVALLMFNADEPNGNNLYWPAPVSSQWEHNFRDTKTWAVTSVNEGIKHIWVASEYQNNKQYLVDTYFADENMSGVSQGPLSPAVLEISVPDQQPLRIEYNYIVTGWEEGNILKFSNAASFYEDNGEGNWNTSDNEMSTDSSATAETLRYPTIYKTDVGNYAINDLQAEFLVAKYTDGQWVYANNITATAGAQIPYRTLEFPEAPYTGFTEAPGSETYPENGESRFAVLRLDKTDQGNHEDIHYFDLEEGVLYKFVEIRSPSEYRQPDWTKGYADNQEFVFYYNYAGFSGTLPAEAADKVRTILRYGTINVPNSQTITLKAEKSFSGSGELPESSTVQFELYWSTSRNGSNQKRVTSETLSVAKTFVPTRTIDYSNGNPVNTVSWEGLPSGYKGSPIYYFVRELSYTENGVTYFYDEASGRYLDADGTEGRFRPVYTGNGTGTDRAVIEVNNSEGIQIRKLWVDQEGNPVTPAKEVDSAGDMEVGFIVYGIKADGTKVRLLLDTEKLTSAMNYEYTLPQENIQGSDGAVYALSDFSNFEVEENLTDEQEASMLGRFLPPKTTRKISNGTGVLEIINTDISAPVTDAAAQKIWKDGNRDHSEDVLLVELVQSTNPRLTSAELQSYVEGGAVGGIYAGNKMKSTADAKLILKGGSGTVTFGSGITAVTGANDAVSVSFEGSTLTYSGTDAGSAELSVTLESGETETLTVTAIENQQELSADNHWKCSWTDLPYSDGENIYYYYVIERSVPDDYTVSYQRTATADTQTTHIINSLPTRQTVQKLWYADGEEMRMDDATLSALPDAITVNVYQKLKTETVGGEDGEEPVTVTTPTDISMPGAYADPASQFSGVLIKTVQLLKSEGYQITFDDLPEKNTDGIEYVYFFKEEGTHVLDSSGEFYTLSESAYQYIDSLTYEHNGLTASEIGTVTIRNSIKTTDLGIVKVWDDEKDHSGDSITVRIHRETVADSEAAMANPLTLELSEAAGSTVYVPIGKQEYTITANKPVKVNVSGDCLDDPIAQNGQKVWKFPLKGSAQEGDEATLTFTDNNETVTVHLKIVNDPMLTLSAAGTTAMTADPADPTLTPEWSMQYTPPGGSVQTVSANDPNVSFTSSNPNAATVDENGVLTVVNGGKTTITASYSDGGETATSEGVELTISLPDFTVSNAEVTIGGDPVKITVTPSYGTFTYESADTGIAEVDENGNVTGVGAGSTTVTVTRTDGSGNPAGSKTVNVQVGNPNVLELTNFQSGTAYDISSFFYANDAGSRVPSQIVITFAGSETESHNGQVILSGGFKVGGWSDNGAFQHSNVQGNFNTYTLDVNNWSQITQMNNATFTMNIWSGSSSVTSLTFIYPGDANPSSGTQSAPASRSLMSRFTSRTFRLSAAMDYTALPLSAGTGEEDTAKSGSTAVSADFNTEDCMEVTITSADGWQQLVSGLPVYKAAADGTLHTYYYWAEEIEINGQPVAGYTVSYSFTDGDTATSYSINAANPGEDPHVTIRNTPKESPTVELPESGGTGTRPAYEIGGILLLVSVIGYLTYKRRRWCRE